LLNAPEIRELLTAKDFKPFAIHLTEGARYDVTHHDMVLVGRNAIEIDIGRDQEVSPNASFVLRLFASRASKSGKPHNTIPAFRSI
jgi:hypothetical protein